MYTHYGYLLIKLASCLILNHVAQAVLYSQGSAVLLNSCVKKERALKPSCAAINVLTVQMVPTNSTAVRPFFLLFCIHEYYINCPWSVNVTN